jgi:hypothetical protein
MLRKGVKLLIKKMVDYKKALVAILENTLENVNAGNTNITEEEASVIIDHLTMLNKGVATVSKAYACEHVLHITSNKFDYLVRKGIIPHGRKRLGFNELSWVLKDLDEAKRYLANNNDQYPFALVNPVILIGYGIFHILMLLEILVVSL